MMHNPDLKEASKGRGLQKEAIDPIRISGCYIVDQGDEPAIVLDRCHGIGLEPELILPDPEERLPPNEVIPHHGSRYRAIIENSMDNIYICEADTGKVIESNGSMRHLLGYSLDEMNELTVFDFLDHPKDEIRNFIDVILERGSLKIKDRRYLRKDRSLVDIEATCCAIDEGGRRLLCVVSRDMTERKEYERQLMEQRNRAELYMDILGHDIGNLHHGIMGFVGLCKQFKDNGEKLNSYLNSIDGLTMRSVHLVDNLKILAGIESQPDDMIEIDPLAMISSCIESVKDSIPWKDPVFQVEMPASRTLMANPHIKHAMYNVLHNAVKYQDPERPVVEISARDSGDGYLLLSVRDFGRGIPESLRTEVFNRFTLNKKHGGMGLSVVRALVDRSAGSVWIEDPKDSKGGTIVVMELPIFI